MKGIRFVDSGTIRKINRYNQLRAAFRAGAVGAMLLAGWVMVVNAWRAI